MGLREPSAPFAFNWLRTLSSLSRQKPRVRVHETRIWDIFERLGRDRLVGGSEFTSVAKGLALRPRDLQRSSRFTSIVAIKGATNKIKSCLNRKKAGGRGVRNTKLTTDQLRDNLASVALPT
jgi:hypothetical protein